MNQSRRMRLTHSEGRPKNLIGTEIAERLQVSRTVLAVTMTTTSVKEFDIDELIERQKLIGSRKGEVDIEKGVQESELVIEWADVKCSYAKKKEEAHTTLFNATGHLKTRELTAIMGRRSVIAFSSACFTF
jgi:hypothetical protein